MHDFFFISILNFEFRLGDA